MWHFAHCQNVHKSSMGGINNKSHDVCNMFDVNKSRMHHNVVIRPNNKLRGRRFGVKIRSVGGCLMLVFGWTHRVSTWGFLLALTNL